MTAPLLARPADARYGALLRSVANAPQRDVGACLDAMERVAPDERLRLFFPAWGCFAAEFAVAFAHNWGERRAARRR